MYPDYFAFSAVVGGTAKTISQRQKILLKIIKELYYYTIFFAWSLTYG